MYKKVACGNYKDLRVYLIILTGFVLSLCICTPVLAATYTVCPSGCNYTSIQDAINHAADGDTIEIYSGQYYEPIIVNRSLILTGVDTGMGYPVIDASGAEYGVTIESPDITLHRLNITGANSSAILIQSDGAHLHELTVIHPKVEPRILTYPAVTGEDISGLDISSCTFQVGMDTVVLYDPCNYSITSNTFQNPKAYSIAIISSGETTPSVNGIISGNSITQERGAGIGIIARSAGGFVDNLTIADNTISGSGGSIGLFIPSLAVTIRNNTLAENPGTPGKGIYGIMTYGTSGVVIADNHVHDTDVELAYRFESCSELNVTGNTVNSNADTGMGFLGVTNSVVSHNTMDSNVYNFWMSPVVLDPGVLPGNQIDQTNLVDGKPVWYLEGVDDLSVDSSDNVGTLILYACDNATIRDLSCTANSAGVLAVRSEHLTITNCSFQQMYQGIMTVASSHLDVRDNHLTDCFDGVMVGDFHDGHVSGNHIENSGDSGIVTGIYLEDVTIADNIIDGAVAGIYLDQVSGFNNVIFSGNTINHTMVAGISASDSQGVVISRNYLDPDSGVGFDISHSSSLNITGNTLCGEAGNAVLLYNAPENSITSNVLTSTENGIVLQRKQSQTGSYDNLITNNRVNSPESVLFCLRGGLGNETNGSKFSEGPETPRYEIPSITLIRSDASGIPEDFTCNPDPTPPQNTWNVTKTTGTNIVGGPFLGGNYWAKPDGTGWSQVTPDRGDGFCTAPFIYDANNTDCLPLHLFEGEIEITAPAVIDRPGRYKLINDLSNSTSDAAIFIMASDIVLNGDGHSLGGAPGENTIGVIAGEQGVDYANITIRNLTITGWVQGIVLKGVTGSTLQDIRATGSRDGIVIDGSPGTTVRNCTAVDNIPLEDQGIFYGGNGVNIVDSPGSRILDSTISHNGWGEELPYVGGYGILLMNNTGLLISGCVIDKNVNTGIWNENSKDMMVLGNQFHDNGGNGGVFMTALLEDPEMNCTIADNTISGSGWGIWLLRNDYLVTNNTVTGCMYGILLDSGRNATLSGNVMYDNEMNFGVDGSDVDNYYHQVDTSNTVDGRPIYYLVEEPDAVVEGASGAGTVFGIACDNLTVRDLILEKNEYGVLLIGSDQAVIRNVTATENYMGICVIESDEVRIETCSGQANTINGFLIKDSNSVRITGSDAFMNQGGMTGTGISVENCQDILIQQVNASQNFFAGVDLENSGQAWLVDVTAESNGEVGIILGGDTIQITGCHIRDNEGPGIGMLNSTNVSIWNNFFSNEMNVDLSQAVVTGSSWSTTKTAHPNIIHGPFLGGNYWATPDGTGFSQTHADRGDGFCNAPYILDEDNTDYLPLHIRAIPPFYADFSASPLSGATPLSVQFTDRSDGIPTIWSYSFGDGSSSSARNPVHTYFRPGTYTVNLTIMNVSRSGLVTNTMVKSGLITVTGPPAPVLVANFTASPLSGTAPLSVYFTDSSTGIPQRYYYSFGDGSSSYARNPIHTYRLPGTYTVKLTIVNLSASGMVTNTTIKSGLIAVNGTPTPALLANFTASPLSGTAPLSVQFTDQSTGDPTQWSYAFGDGFSSSARNPVHTFRWPGTYTVKLTAMKISASGLITNTTVKDALVKVS